MRIRSFVQVGVLVGVFGLLSVQSGWAQGEVQLQVQAPSVTPAPFVLNVRATRFEGPALSGLRAPLFAFWGVTAAEVMVATTTTPTWTPDRALSMGALVGLAGLNTYFWRQVADGGHPRLAKVVLWTLTGLHGTAAVYVAGFERRP